MADTIVRSRLCGLKDIYVAPVLKNDGTTYETGAPVKIGRALNAKVSDKFNTEKEYSDDGIEDIIESYEGTEIEFGVNTLAPQDYSLLFDTLYENGFLIKSSSDSANEIAIGWRAKRRNGKYEFSWYYCGKLERPDMNYESQADKLKTQTATLKGSFYARQKEDIIDGKRKNLYAVQVDESNLLDENTSAKAAISNWFKSVQEYNKTAVTSK